MKIYRYFAAVMAVVCLMEALCACGSRTYEQVRSFEYHFVKEEYEETYDEVEKEIALDTAANHQIRITASCITGTISLTIRCTDGKELAQLHRLSAPCDEIIEIPRGTADAVAVTAGIDPETEGTLAVEVLSDR